MNKPVITYFDSPNLNEVGAELIELYKKSKHHLRKAKDHLSSAVERRWRAGKYVAENYDEIIEECGTQRKFAEMIGVTESMVSNDKRSYVALKEEGAETFEEAKKLMQQKGIKESTRLWEKLPKLLTEPQSELDKDRRAKDEKRLEDLHQEIEEIKARNEGANPAVAERAEDTLRYNEGVKEHIEAQDVFKSDWRSRDYLDFVRSIGFDYLTMEPCENPDPHHINPITGRSQGPHGKVSDIFTIPVSRYVHNEIQGKDLTIKEKLEMSEAMIRTLALFVTTNMKGDNE